MQRGIPFSMTIPSGLKSRDAMSREEFDEILRTGFEQAKADDSISVDEAFV